MKIYSLIVLLCVLQVTFTRNQLARRASQHRQVEFEADRACIQCSLSCAFHLGSCKECVDSPSVCPNGRCTWKSNKCPSTQCLMEDGDCPSFYQNIPGSGCDCNEGYLKCHNGTCVSLDECNEYRKTQGLAPRVLNLGGDTGKDVVRYSQQRHHRRHD